jgi:hypothetical protein
VPLFDLMKIGRERRDPRMLFSWYGADYTTDPDFQDLDPEGRANPSMNGPTWDSGYLQQQRTRLPSHKFRRLHLNLPGLPEGSAYTAEMVMDAVDRNVRERPPQDGVAYRAFVDMSGGSSDDAFLAIAHKDQEGHGVLDCLVDQGPEPPFDPNKAVPRFVDVMKRYRVIAVTGDAYAGQTFRMAFEGLGVAFRREARGAAPLPDLAGRQDRPPLRRTRRRGQRLRGRDARRPARGAGRVRRLLPHQEPHQRPRPRARAGRLRSEVRLEMAPAEMKREPRRLDPLKRWKRRVAADLGGNLNVTQKTLLEHAAMTKKSIDALAGREDLAAVEARARLISQFGRTMDRLRAHRRRRAYERD